MFRCCLTKGIEALAAKSTEKVKNKFFQNDSTILLQISALLFV